MKKMVESVSERTGGVPLFVEEVTRLLLERGVEAGGGRRRNDPADASTVARCAARPRLGEAREVAQIGAVLGRDFAYTLLRAMGGIDDRALQSGLDRLAEADLLVAEGAGLQASYRFKHAPIQRRGLREPAQEPSPDATPPLPPKSLRGGPSALRPDRKSSLIISTKPASTTSRSNGGARQEIRPCAVQPSRRRSPISARR